MEGPRAMNPYDRTSYGMIVAEASPGTRIRVLGPDLVNIMAEGVGRLVVALPVGLYKVEFAAGDSEQTRLVNLPAQSVVVRQPTPLVPSRPHARIDRATARRVARALGAKVEPWFDHAEHFLVFAGRGTLELAALTDGSFLTWVHDTDLWVTGSMAVAEE